MTVQPKEEVDGGASGDFQEAVAEAGLGMRSALATLVTSLPGGGVNKPSAMQRLLKLDYKICWSVFNVIRSSDPMAAANLMPKRPSIERLLEACERVGVATGVVAALKEAADRFDEVIRVHAGNRIVFDAMVNGMAASGGRPQIDLVERRTAFRSNTHIWGRQTETFVATGIVRRNPEDPSRIDQCMMSWRLGYKRLRPGANATMYRYRKQEDDGQPGAESGLTARALDEEGHRLYGASLIREFCTQPLPEFKDLTSKHGKAGQQLVQELMDDAIGQRGAVDLAFGGATFRAVPEDGGNGPEWSIMADFTTPAGRLVMDMVVHRPSFGRVKPSVEIFDAVPMYETTYQGVRRPVQALPVAAQAIALAGGVAGAQTPDAPRHLEMLRYAFKSLGWDAGEFDVYRVVVDYPILHSVVQMGFVFREAVKEGEGHHRFLE